MWAGDGGEGAKYWLTVLTELKDRGVADVLMVVCNGLAGLPDAITAVWSRTITQTCIVHLLRNSFRYAGRQHGDAIAKALKPVCTAATEAAGIRRSCGCGTTRGGVRAVPGLRPGDPARDIRSTNALESVHARIRRAVKARGDFPNEPRHVRPVGGALSEGRAGMKIWLITRMSRGFGLEIAWQALDAGDTVVATACEGGR
ncbi:transposase [Amycolatopsis sp. NPDC004378]